MSSASPSPAPRSGGELTAVSIITGLVLSIALMGLAATYIARLLERHRWIAYAGLILIVYVALHMIWKGGSALALTL